MGKSKFCGKCGEVREHTHILAALYVCSGCGAEVRIFHTGRGRPPILSPDKVVYVREEYKAGRTVKALARKLQVNLSIIYAAINGPRKVKG